MPSDEQTIFPAPPSCTIGAAFAAVVNSSARLASGMSIFTDSAAQVTAPCHLTACDIALISLRLRGHTDALRCLAADQPTCGAADALLERLCGAATCARAGLDEGDAGLTSLEPEVVTPCGGVKESCVIWSELPHRPQHTETQELRAKPHTPAPPATGTPHSASQGPAGRTCSGCARHHHQAAHLFTDRLTKEYPGTKHGADSTPFPGCAGGPCITPNIAVTDAVTAPLSNSALPSMALFLLLSRT
ncbi:hypothetical protein [Desulfobaculum senezii]